MFRCSQGKPLPGVFKPVQQGKPVLAPEDGRTRGTTSVVLSLERTPRAAPIVEMAPLVPRYRADPGASSRDETGSGAGSGAISTSGRAARLASPRTCWTPTGSGLVPVMALVRNGSDRRCGAATGRIRMANAGVGVIVERTARLRCPREVQGREPRLCSNGASIDSRARWLGHGLVARRSWRSGQRFSEG